MKRRKRFDCGHSGKGKYCHRCAIENEERLEKAKDSDRRGKQLASYGIRLDHVPLSVADRAVLAMARLKQGDFHSRSRGKRIVSQRDVISIRINRRFRLICKAGPAGAIPVEVLDHKTYERRLSTRYWSKRRYHTNEGRRNDANS